MVLRLKRSFLIWAFATMCLYLSGCSQQGGLSQTPDTGKTKQVELITNRGRIVLELYEDKAPITVANFLRYVEEGFYRGLIFHRIVPKFVIQAGGYDTSMKRKPTYDPIINESINGLSNTRGTVAMARAKGPDTATSQFYFNVVDNPQLDYAGEDKPGYAVFGKVLEGMDVVDKIANAPRGRGGKFMHMPTKPIFIKSAAILEDK
jgi:cyclophilin family peptidyl-prolyl cis-trans isomerase